jgi:Flp pilus assembly pilin Flp
MMKRFPIVPAGDGQRGQGNTEYGLILMLIGLIVIGTLMLMGQSVHELYHNVSHAMPR